MSPPRAPAWQTLLAEVRGCRLCESATDPLPLGARPVLQLHPQARVLVVGQAPGRRVHESGLPFNDPSGERLRDWMGVSREVFYDARRVAIVPMGFCYPGTGKSGDLPPRPLCASTWRARVLALLPHIELALIIGQYALDWHLNHSHGASAAEGNEGRKNNGAQAKGHGARSLTTIVQGWRHYLARTPSLLPMPHPSPRNNLWLKRNPWFEAEVIPVLRTRLQPLLA